MVRKTKTIARLRRLTIASASASASASESGSVWSLPGSSASSLFPSSPLPSKRERETDRCVMDTRSSRSEDEIINALIRTAGLGAAICYIQGGSGDGGSKKGEVGRQRERERERKCAAAHVQEQPSNCLVYFDHWGRLTARLQGVR